MTYQYSEPLSYAVAANGTLIIESPFRRSSQFSIVALTVGTGTLYIGSLSSTAATATLAGTAYGDVNGVISDNKTLNPHWFQAPRFLTFAATTNATITLQFRRDTNERTSFDNLQVTTDPAFEHLLQQGEKK